MTAKEKIEALGGVPHVAAMFGKKRTAVAMWANRNKIPYTYEFPINLQLKEKGYDV